MRQTITPAGRIARFSLAAGSAAALALTLGVSSAYAATPELKDVQRSGAGLTDITMSWPAVADTDHYTVSISAGANQALKTVPGNETSAVFSDVAPACDRIRVQVTAVGTDGSQTKTSIKRLSRTAPGGVRNIQASRSNNGSNASLTWTAPFDPGMSPITNYTVVVKQLSNGNTLINRTSKDESISLDALDGNRQYVAKVTANNEYGSCITSTAMFLNQKPTPPRNPQAWREAGDPRAVHVEWDEPSWAGYGGLTGYEVMYRPGNRKNYQSVKVDSGRSTTLDLAADRRWSIYVRAYSGNNNRSKLSKEVWILRADEPLPIEEDPRVEATAAGRVVTVNFSGPVGSSKKYPKMVVAVAPSDGAKGPSQDHEVANGTSTVVFNRVKCGDYTLVVTGIGKDKAKEFARLTFDRCDL